MVEQEVEQGTPTRPECKTLADLERVIALGKPQRVIDTFAEMVAAGIYWDGVEAQEQWEADYTLWELAKQDFVSELLEDGTYTEFVTEAPVQPEEPELLTGAQVYAPYRRAQLKLDRANAIANIVVEVDGHEYDGDELSQTRMLKAITVLVGDQEMPWTLANNEVILVTQTELKKALTLAGTAQSALWQIS